MDTTTTIRKIVAACGSQSRLATALNLKPMAISQWKRRGRIPVEHVLAIEQLTGGQVTRHEMRPDLYPIERVQA